MDVRRTRRLAASLAASALAAVGFAGAAGAAGPPAGMPGRPEIPDTGGVRPVVPGVPELIEIVTPAGTVSISVVAGSGATVLAVPTPSGSIEADLDGLNLLDEAYEIEVEADDFEQADLCVPYDEEEVADAGLEESELELFHFPDDGDTEVITTSVDTVENEVCGTTTSFSPFAVGVLETGRVAGADRYATAAAVSASRFGAGVPVVYVTTGAAFPDALSAGPAAAASRGPVLLVSPDAVPATVADELERLDPERIVVVGGPGAVSDAVLAVLGERAPVERIAGPDRTTTSALVSAATFPAGVDVAYVASSSGFADALAGGAAAAAEDAPLLLTGRDTLPAAVAAELERLDPERVVVLGGTGAVSDAVLAAVADATGAVTERVAGADRYATAAAVTARTFAPGTPVYVATGTSFPDALAGIAAAAVDGAALLLVGDVVSAAVAAELDRLAPPAIVVLGGEGVVPVGIELDLANRLPSDRMPSLPI